MKKNMIIFIIMLKMELKLYIRSWWLWSVALVLILYLGLGYYTFFITDDTYGDLLQASAYIVMAGILLGMFTGMFFSQRERKAKFEEVIHTLPSHQLLPLAKSTAWSLNVLLFCLMSTLMVLGMYRSVESELIIVWYKSMGYILIYWGLPFLSAGFIGYGLDQLIHSPWKYGIAFLIWRMISPYNTFLPTKIRFLLNQGQENPNDPYNVFQGFNIGIDMLLRHLFLLSVAIIFVIITVLLRYDLPKKQKNFLVTNIVLLVIVGIIMVPHGDHKIIFNEDEMFAVQDQDILFYQQDQDAIQHIEYFPDFQVEQYNMDFHHIKDTISYTTDIKISIPEQKNVDELDFSLYHGLKVKEVRFRDKEIKWEQKGDDLWISWNPEIHEGEIRVEIDGTTGYKNPITQHSFF